MTILGYKKQKALTGSEDRGVLFEVMSKKTVMDQGNEEAL